MTTLRGADAKQSAAPTSEAGGPHAHASCALTRARARARPRAAPAAPAGKLGEAEPLFREALAASRETLGDRHPDTLTSINNMASLLKAQGAPARPPGCTRACGQGAQ